MKATTFYKITIGIWIILLIPTVTTWKESITYLVFLSWYANFSTDINNFITAKTKEKMKNGRG